ncbi:hypothetical protein TOK_1649 [Pseudonocardia sp. N23]|nr:hypothetical protein TOK_1649 [Pseudonocardia sp. N23]
MRLGVSLVGMAWFGSVAPSRSRIVRSAPIRSRAQPVVRT